MCEHHFLPFFGKISVAYVPNGKIVGFGDIVKVIEAYAKSLGYSLDLDEEFNNSFQSELRKMYPVVKYMYNEPTWKRTLHLLKVTNISDVISISIV
mgnify:CR=1 FL=1